jgi:hypothetical protein
MANHRFIEEDAWIALSALCVDLDVPMLDCPTHIVEKYSAMWQRQEVRVALRGCRAGLSICGMRVVWYKAAEGGQRSGGGYWTDGVSNIDGSGSWRELCGRIAAAREGIELVRRGLPWARKEPAGEEPNEEPDEELARLYEEEQRLFGSVTKG